MSNACQIALAQLSSSHCGANLADLQQLHQAVEQAFQQAKAAATNHWGGRKGGTAAPGSERGVDSDVDIKVLAKEAGPLAMGTCVRPATFGSVLNERAPCVHAALH
jgi:hypothetical protein